MKEYPLYPELTEQGKKEAQELINKFEANLKEQAIKIMEEITTDFYCNVLNEIESDHWINYRSKILNELCNYSNKSIQASNDYDRIRKSIYKHHKEDIIKDLNQDLLKEIEMLKKTIEMSNKW
jgi:hypothetical protein